MRQIGRGGRKGGCASTADAVVRQVQRLQVLEMGSRRRQRCRPIVANFIIGGIQRPQQRKQARVLRQRYRTCIANATIVFDDERLERRELQEDEEEGQEGKILE